MHCLIIIRNVNVSMRNRFYEGGGKDTFVVVTEIVVVHVVTLLSQVLRVL